MCRQTEEEVKKNNRYKKKDWVECVCKSSVGERVQRKKKNLFDNCAVGNLKCGRRVAGDSRERERERSGGVG